MANDDTVTVLELEQLASTPQRSLEERVQHLKDIISKGNEATKAIEDNMKYIKDHEYLISETNNKEPGVAYLPLHWSKHKDFIECVQMLSDFVSDKDELKAAAAAQSYPKLKEQLCKVKKDAQRNVLLSKEIKPLSAEVDLRLDQFQLFTIDSQTTY